MKTKFVFDKNSGTMKALKQQEPAPAPESSPLSIPEDAEEVRVELNSQKPNVDMDEPIVQFHQDSDFTIFQVNEERTGRPMMIIGGYGLEIKFNMGELRSTERIEELLGGLTSLFRKLILDQALGRVQSK